MAFRRFDGLTIEPNHRRATGPCVPRESVEEGRFPDACNAMQVNNERPILIQRLEKKPDFFASANEIERKSAIQQVL
jgi:hypothetical protein